MNTQKLYLEDAYLQTMTATLLEATLEAEGMWKVVLSQTVFYPKGGGQPTDQGLLFTQDWEGKVIQVLNQQGLIVHYVEATTIPPTGTLLQGRLDWERRYLNMRLHSAGHVIDFALYQLGYSPSHLKPLKADHGKKPMIWYEGAIDKDFKEELQKQANLIVTYNLRFSTAFVSYDELASQALYLQPQLPKDQSLRMLTLDGVGSVADGGTQVNFTSEIGFIEITNIEVKKETTLIRYALHEKAPS